MSQLREALASIMSCDFRTASPPDQAQLGVFLERAAEEIKVRLDALEQREQDTSAREAAVELRERAVEAQIKALGSVQRVRRTLGTSTEVKKVGWWR